MKRAREREREREREGKLHVLKISSSLLFALFSEMVVAAASRAIRRNDNEMTNIAAAVKKSGT